MKKKVLLILSALASMGGVIQAQDGLPSNPDGNKCYVKCVTPDVYKDTTIKILKRPAYTKLEIIPSEYKTVTETYVVKEASKRYEYVPATYKWVEERVMVTEGHNKLAIVPSKFSPSNESIEVMPAVGRWEMGERSPDCESVNPMDCRVLCWKEYPAQYVQIPNSIKDKDETTNKTAIEAQYKTIRRQVIDRPATYTEVAIPAQTATIEKRVLVKDENTRTINVPAEYETVKKTVLVSKGGLSVWRELNCSFTQGVLLPIYYSTGSAELTSASTRIIDEKIYSLMKNEPLISVEIMSHTDSRSDDAANMALSQRRAESVVNYLVSKGIAKNRLLARGYGETRLTNRCRNGVNCSDAEHQPNRRTEFRVISK